ncbi:lysophospholipid acyltransferase family protein [Aquimarina sp. M1]
MLREDMRALKRIVSYPLSIVFYLFFGLTLLVFHPLQWLGVKLGGAKGHRSVINMMNLCLLRCLHVLGVRISFKNQYKLPKDRSLIIVSNHQSMFDVPLISWYLHKHKPKFISKMELGKGIPSISYNLRHGGHALIDRKNAKQSIPEISKFARFIAGNKFSAVIYPEGTRSKNGKPKQFAPTGLKILLKNAPESLVVPVTINNSWKIVRFGNFPMGIGIHLTLEVNEPVVVEKLTVEEILDITERRVISTIKT